MQSAEAKNEKPAVLSTSVSDQGPKNISGKSANIVVNYICARTKSLT